MGHRSIAMSYHTIQQRTAPGKFGVMPTFNRNSNGPIQPSTMAVTTSGGANRFTVENYLPSAEAPKPNPVRYTPSDLNLDDLLHTKRAPDPNEWLGPKSMSLHNTSTPPTLGLLNQ